MDNYSFLFKRPMDEIIHEVVMRYDADYLTAENIATDVLNFSDLLRDTEWWKSFRGDDSARHKALIQMAWEIEYMWIDPAWDDGYYETYEGFLSIIGIDENGHEPDCDDANLEMGFDPYLGCYTEDC